MSPFASRSDAESWLLKWHAAGDSLDAERWLTTFWTDDAVLQFANSADVVGAEAIINNFKASFALLKSMKHEIKYFDVVEKRIYQRADISYVLKGDEKTIVVPGFAVFFLRDEGAERGWRVERFEVFLDGSPLFQRMGEIANKEQV
ncbi:hypothetical protein BJ742DRAFT_796365 [Cladochytrium replicatum]|nr:hypothetical protein BJ742DRAFT_796365 [Cladochytrium replicatum]